MKSRDTASTHKKVIVVLLDGKLHRGYLNPASLGGAETIALLTPDGENVQFALERVKSIHFVREFPESFEPGRKAFFSRPKLEGLWVRLKFRDHDDLEGVVPNDLLAMLDHGVQITPPDLHGNSVRIFIPRTALAGLTVLGVVGAPRRAPAGAPASTAVSQRKLFGE